MLAVLQPIWFKSPETARRVRQRIRQVMHWAKGANLYTDENPVDAAAGSLPRQNAQQRHFPAMPYNDLAAFMEALSERRGAAGPPPPLAERSSDGAEMVEDFRSADGAYCAWLMSTRRASF